MKPEIRNSIPPQLAFAQRWMESERLLHRLLPIEQDAPLTVLRIRRNFKFRKLIVESGEDRFVCYIHHWPRGLRNLAALSNLAKEVDVCLPDPIQQTLGWAAALRQGCFSLVLPYVDGNAIGSQASLDQLNVLGKALGRLHGQRGRQWGPLMTNFRTRGDYWSGLQAYWQQTEKQLLRHGDFARKNEISMSMQWLRQEGLFLEHMDQFNLIHGDPASGNFLIRPDGELCLIDCDRIAYEPGAMELANALLQGYCSNDTGRRISLAGAYLSQCPADVKESWESQAHFYIAAALLWRGQRKLQWSIKRHTAGQSSQRARHAWQQLLHVISAQPSDWQSAVALLEN